MQFVDVGGYVVGWLVWWCDVLICDVICCSHVVLQRFEYMQKSSPDAGRVVLPRVSPRVLAGVVRVALALERLQLPIKEAAAVDSLCGTWC